MSSSLHVADYVVFALMLVASLSVGLYYAFTGGRQRTTDEYFMGNRKLKVIPVGMSMFMSTHSAIFILGVTAEVYKYGIGVWLGWFGRCLCYIFTAVVLIPLFHPLKITTGFEYVDKRFKSRALRVTTVCLLIVSRTFYAGMAMYAPGTAIEAVTGFPLWANILLLGIVTTIYTTLGGMKGVIYTDALQCIIMVSGTIAIVAVGATKVGGLGEVWSISERAGRTNLLNFDPDPAARLTTWSLVIGQFFSSLSSTGTAQMFIQRYCALPTIKQGQVAMLLSIPLTLIMTFLIGLSALVIFAYYDSIQCDPLRSGELNNANQLLPYFVLNLLSYPGLMGLFISVLFSGAISTVSSCLNSLSAVTWKDLMEPHLKRMKESRKTLITKTLVAVYGCLGIGVAFLASILPGNIWSGAMVGAIVSLLLTTWINVGANVTSPHREFLNTTVANCTFLNGTYAKPMPTDPTGVLWPYKISFIYMTGIGTIVCMVVGLLVSFIAGGNKNRESDPDLMVPISDRLFCYLPKSFRRYMWCGVDYQRQSKTKPEDSKELEHLQPNGAE